MNKIIIILLSIVGFRIFGIHQIIFNSESVDKSLEQACLHKQLFAAVKNNNKAIIKELIDNGADSSYAIQTSREALSDCRASINKTSDYRATEDMVNAKDIFGWPLLKKAVHQSNKAIIEILIDKGPDINAKNKTNGLTPLHWAICGGNKEIAELLVSKRANVNARDEYGYTPLHEAASRNNKDLITLVMAKGADKNIKNKIGQLAVNITSSKEIIELIGS